MSCSLGSFLNNKVFLRVRCSICVIAFPSLYQVEKISLLKCFIRKRHGPAWVDGYPIREPSYDRYGKPEKQKDPLDVRTKHEKKLQNTFVKVNTRKEYEDNNDKWGTWLTWPRKKGGRKAPRPNSLKAQIDRMAKLDDKPITQYISEEDNGDDDDEENNDELSKERKNLKDTGGDLGKGSSPTRLLGESIEVDNRKIFSSSREIFPVNFDPGTERLPSLGLGRAYDTGLRFDRSRPFLRHDRYANQFLKTEIKPRVLPDGSLDTRPFLESELSYTPAVSHLGGDNLIKSRNGEPWYENTRNTSQHLKRNSPYSRVIPRHPHLPNPPPLPPKKEYMEKGLRPASEEYFDRSVNERIDFTPLGSKYRLPMNGPNFRGMSSWQEVAECVRQMDPNDDPQYLSQAFHSIKGMNIYPPAEFLIELADLCIAQSHRMLPISLSNIIHACAKLRFVYPPLIEAWEKHLNNDKMLEACTDMDITCLCFSFGQLNRQMKYKRRGPINQKNQNKSNKINISNEFRDRLALEASHPLRVQNYSHSMFINVFHGLCLLNLENPELVEKFLNVLIRPEFISQLSEQNITTLLYSLGYTRYTHNMKAVEIIISEIISRAPKLASQGISNTFWAIGNLKYDNQELIRKIAKVATEEARLRAFTEQDLTNVLFGISIARLREPDILGPIAAEYMRPGRLVELHEVGISNLLFSFSQLKYRDEALIKAAVQELTSIRRLKTLNNQTIGSSMYGLGTFQFRNLDVVQPLLDEIVDPDRLNTFSENDLSNIIYGLGHMRVRYTEILNTIMEEAGKECRIRNFTNQGLINVLTMSVQVGYRDEDLLINIGRELVSEKRLRHLNETGMALAVNSFVRNQIFDPVIFKPLLNVVVLPSMLEKAKGSALADILFGCLRAEVVDFSKFSTIANSFRSPMRLQSIMNFYLSRIIMVCSIVGLRDDELLKSFRDEILRDGRHQSFGNQDRRDLAKAFERLAYYDDEICAFLGYNIRDKGQRTGILAPGALKAIKKYERMKEEESKDIDKLDWAGLPSTDAAFLSML